MPMQFWEMYATWERAERERQEGEPMIGGADSGAWEAELERAKNDLDRARAESAPEHEIARLEMIYNKAQLSKLVVDLTAQLRHRRFMALIGYGLGVISGGALGILWVLYYLDRLHLSP